MAGKLGKPGASNRDTSSELARVLAKGRLRAALATLGPVFIASVADVDPANFATNIEGGARYGYLLLWVVLAANLIAMLVQYLSGETGAQPGGAVVRHSRSRWCRLSC